MTATPSARVLDTRRTSVRIVTQARKVASGGEPVKGRVSVPADEEAPGISPYISSGFNFDWREPL
jgi:hypothetical protein